MRFKRLLSNKKKKSSSKKKVVPQVEFTNFLISRKKCTKCLIKIFFKFLEIIQKHTLFGSPQHTHFQYIYLEQCYGYIYLISYLHFNVFCFRNLLWEAASKFLFIKQSSYDKASSFIRTFCNVWEWLLLHKKINLNNGNVEYWN